MIVVLITAPDEESAAGMARTLVDERLAACVNIITGGVRSIYRWEGSVHDETECLMLVKTVADKFDALKERVVELHGYEVPEVVALPVVKGLETYFEWVEENTRLG